MPTLITVPQLSAPHSPCPVAPGTQSAVLAAPTAHGLAARPRYSTVLLLALAPRLAMVFYVLTHFAPGWLFTKGMELGILGRQLALGHPYNSPFGGNTGPTAFITPGYPFLISRMFRIFGIETRASVAAILLMHVLFGIATVALVMHLARQLAGVPAANLAGLFWALSPTAFWTPVIFWDTSASAMLLTGMAAVALELRRHPTLLLWSSAGLYCGLTLWINPSLCFALLAMLAWAAYSAHLPTPAAPRRPRFAPAVAVLILLAVFLPWPIRNARVLHAFIPFRTNLGYELWNGNQHGGNGKFVENLHPMLSQQQYREYAALGELAYMREKTDAGKATISAHPVEFLRITAWRIPAFWLGLAQGGSDNSGLVVLHAAITCILGFAGLALLLRHRRSEAWLFLLPMLLFPLPYYLTHPDFRFRLLLDPMLTILAACAVTAVTAEWRRARRPHQPHAWR